MYVCRQVQQQELCTFPTQSIWMSLLTLTEYNNKPYFPAHIKLPLIGSLTDTHRLWSLRGTNCTLKRISAEFSSLGYGKLPVSQHGGPFSIPCESVWGLWWTQRYWEKISSDYFGFALPVLFHQCSIFTFMYMVLLSGGQVIEACEPSKKRCISQSRERWIESCCHSALEFREIRWYFWIFKQVLRWCSSLKVFMLDFYVTHLF